MYVRFSFDPDSKDDIVLRRLALLAATNCGLIIESLSIREFAVCCDTAEDAYRLGVEHGRLLIEHERNQDANAHRD